jgi:hypothetical protein
MAAAKVSITPAFEKRIEKQADIVPNQAAHSSLY